MSIIFPNASSTTAGLITTGAQTLAGTKTFSAVTNFASGSVSAPGIAFSGASVDTGFYRAGGDSIGIAASAVQIGVASAGGSWTLGPITTSAAHNLRGDGGIIVRVDGAANSTNASSAVLDIKARGTSDTSHAATLRFTAGNNVSTQRWDIASGPINGHLSFISLGTPATCLLINAAGAHAIGPTVTNNFNGQLHTLSGSLFSGNVTSTDQSGIFFIGDNVRFGTSNAALGRTNTTTGGMGIALDNRTTSSARGFSIVANLAGDATTLTGTVIAEASHTGNWTFGGSTSSTHVTSGSMIFNMGNTKGVQVSRTGNAQSIWISPNDSTGAFIAGGTDPDGNATQTSDGVGRIILQGASTVGITFDTAPGTTAGAARSWTNIGSASNAGVWTLGKSSSFAGNRIYGTSNGTAMPAGFVGEKITLTARAITTDSPSSWKANASALANFSAGIWIIFYACDYVPTAGPTIWRFGIATTSSNDAVGIIDVQSSATTANGATVLDHRAWGIYHYVLSSAQDVFAKLYTEDATATGTISGFAVRIS